MDATNRLRRHVEETAPHWGTNMDAELAARDGVDRATCAYRWAVRAELRATPEKDQQVRELEAAVGQARTREQARQAAAELHRLLASAAQRVETAIVGKD